MPTIAEVYQHSMGQRPGSGPYYPGFDADLVIGTHNLPDMVNYVLTVVQDPRVVEATEATGEKKKDKRGRLPWPLEPIPVIEVTDKNSSQTNRCLNIHPSMFLFAELLPAPANPRQIISQSELQGNRVASIFRCKSKDKTSQKEEENGYFFFPELHVQYPGQYYFRYSLHEMVVDPKTNNQHAMLVTDTTSKTFCVVGKGQMPPAMPASPVIERLDAAGAKIRLRKPVAAKKKKKVDWSSDMQEVSQVVGREITQHKRGQAQADAFGVGVIEATERSSFSHNPSVTFADTTYPPAFTSPSDLGHSGMLRHAYVGPPPAFGNPWSSGEVRNSFPVLASPLHHDFPQGPSMVANQTGFEQQPFDMSYSSAEQPHRANLMVSQQTNYHVSAPQFPGTEQSHRTNPTVSQHANYALSVPQFADAEQAYRADPAVSQHAGYAVTAPQFAEKSHRANPSVTQHASYAMTTPHVADHHTGEPFTNTNYRDLNSRLEDQTHTQYHPGQFPGH